MKHTVMNRVVFMAVWVSVVTSWLLFITSSPVVLLLTPMWVAIAYMNFEGCAYSKRN